MSVCLFVVSGSFGGLAVISDTFTGRWAYIYFIIDKAGFVGDVFRAAEQVAVAKRDWNHGFEQEFGGPVDALARAKDNAAKSG